MILLNCTYFLEFKKLMLIRIGMKYQAAFFLTISSLGVHAASVVMPSTGSLLQEDHPVAPQEPSSDSTGLAVNKATPLNGNSSVVFFVRKIQISGNKIIPGNVLHSLVASKEGTSLSLAQLHLLTAKITDYYRSHHYPLARAVIPEQVINDGVVNILVIEAHFGQVRTTNQSRVHDSLIEATLAPLMNHAVVEQTTLNRSLLLLQDIPGVTSIQAIMKPGKEVGSSDLQVNMAGAPWVTGNVSVDDYGNAYTGRFRTDGSVSLVNPWHHGDELTLNGMTTGSDMNYASASYETTLNGSGTKSGVLVSSMHYILGNTLASLDANGTAVTTSLWAKHPFLRTQVTNIYGQIQYDYMNLQDNIDINKTYNHRHVQEWTGTLSGDVRDNWWSGGAVSLWSVSLASGHVGFDDAVAQRADASTAKTQNGFTKLDFSASRQQILDQNNLLNVSLSGQWANANLDVSQQLVAGGPYSVRAYDMGVLTGDSGYLWTVEWRHQLGRLISGDWQALAFFDSERLTINRNVWAAGANNATLSGTGVGLNWSGPLHWDAKLYAAVPIGSTPVQLHDPSAVRVWMLINKAF